VRPSRECVALGELCVLCVAIRFEVAGVEAREYLTFGDLLAFKHREFNQLARIFEGELGLLRGAYLTGIFEGSSSAATADLKDLDRTYRRGSGRYFLFASEYLAE
jgi:hypothetical protein